MNDCLKISQDVIKVIKKVIKKDSAPLHEPIFDGNEWNYLKDCIDSTYVSSVGKFVDQFEADLVKYTKSKYAIATVNGTAALHIALKLVNLKKDDEVLIPSLSFVATANAVTYSNATPHFVDSAPNTLGIDPEKLNDYLSTHTEQKSGFCFNKSTNKRIKAIIPMHTFGHPVELEPLIKVTKKFNIDIVEDAAESLGSFYKGKHTGTFGLVGTLSFNGNKIITTGGGGAILTNNKEIAVLARHLTTTAKIKHQWEFIHDMIGYNYRMPNINAALGCSQLERINQKLKIKRALFARYDEEFSKIDGISLFSEPKDARSNYWLQTLVLEDKNIEIRDDILKITNEMNIQTRPIWKPLHQLEPFKNYPSMNVDNAISLYERIINIPSSSNLI